GLQSRCSPAELIPRGWILVARRGRAVKMGRRDRRLSRGSLGGGRGGGGAGRGSRGGGGGAGGVGGLVEDDVDEVLLGALEGVSRFLAGEEGRRVHGARRGGGLAPDEEDDAPGGGHPEQDLGVAHREAADVADGEQDEEDDADEL